MRHYTKSLRSLLLVTFLLFMTIVIYSNHAGAAEAIKSVNAIAFGSGNVLFVADSQTGMVHALPIKKVENPGAKKGYNLLNVGKNIASLLGTTQDNMIVRDMAVNPDTKEAYIAFAVANNDSYSPAIVVVNQEGEVRLFDLGVSGKSVKIPNAPAEDFDFYNRMSSRSLTFTDLDFYKGRLLISGLSNADFAASLWLVKYPFTDDKPVAASVEIYHTVHSQQETRAPVRAITVRNINGQDMVLAAYTCTPLAAFPLSELKNGAHVVGKVIAELGYGNTPIDLLSFDVQNQKGEKKAVLFVNNKNRDAYSVDMSYVGEAVKGDGLTSPVGFDRVGLKLTDLPQSGLLRVADQSPMHIAALRRDYDTGGLQLVSMIKGIYFRLSDFESEYDFPDYVYEGEQKKILLPTQNMLRQDEGFTDKIVK